MFVRFFWHRKELWFKKRILLGKNEKSFCLQNKWVDLILYLSSYLHRSISFSVGVLTIKPQSSYPTCYDLFSFHKEPEHLRITVLNCAFLRGRDSATCPPYNRLIYKSTLGGKK